MELINHYFPKLSTQQQSQFKAAMELYVEWNQRINVVSRKDIDQLEERHMLHGLAIAKVQEFKPGSRILDVGTGGGFPGIPLAILFPETEFVLVDSIQKKIQVVNAIAQELKLDNVTALAQRAEKTQGNFDFVVSRAVTKMDRFVPWVRNKISKDSYHELENGILYLKGGDLTDELKTFKRAKVYPIANYFTQEFFETKAVVYLPL